jgi:crotonobetainyl-CoA:carnitine CoA-transferase CaiB-like acyl-CoA transferase
LNLAAEQVIEYSAHGVLLDRHGNRMPHAAPQGLFPSRDPERLVAVSVTREEHWRALCRLLDAKDWRHSEALSSHRGRLEQHDMLCDRVAAWVGEHSSEEAVEALLAEGIPASPVQNAHDLMPNDQLIDRHFFQTMKHPVVGEVRYPGLPFRFALFERELHRSPPPTLGQHNREVLQGELGLDDEDLEALEREGIIGTRPSFM